jgi:hypothetical protein
MKTTTKTFAVLLLTVATSLGCEARRRRRAAYEEAKTAVTNVEKALGQKLQTDGRFCPAPKDAADAGWKCIGITPAGTYCQFAYTTNDKEDADAEAMLTATCDPNKDGKELKFTLKVKGTLTGDVQRLSMDQPPPP